MSKLLVTGRKKLDGEVEVQGAKNSALPIIAASILTKGENVIHNCPSLSDVDASVNILRYLGCAATRCDKTLLVKCDDINRFDVPVELMRKQGVQLFSRCNPCTNGKGENFVPRRM